jgi:pimeloyl-ACP methyl ester carboxylesterase
MVTDRGTVGGLDQRVMYGRTYKPGAKKGVLTIPGALGTMNDFFDLNFPILDAIHKEGFATASLTTALTWGNDAIQAGVSTLRNNCITSGLFAAGKVHLMGISMGGLTVLNWARANPTLVQSITLVIPVLNVQGVYDQNRGGFTTLIAPGAYPARPPDDYNPLTNVASFAGVPINLYYSTTDPITLEAETLAFGHALGLDLRSMGPQGHGSAPPWGGPDAAGWIAAND